MEATAIVLAGGKNSRMGKNKAFLQVGQKTIIDGLVNELKTSFNEIIISSNDPELYDYLQVKVVKDIIPGLGPLSGMHSALQEAKYDKSLILACDMPFLNLQLAELLVQEAQGYDIAIPKLDEHLEPLFAVYDKSCVEFIETCLKNNISKIIDFYPKVKVNYLSWDRISELVGTEDVFFNVNTPQDLQKARRLGNTLLGGTNMKTMLPIEEAQQLVLSEIFNLPGEEVELLQASGRILAEEVTARDSLPPFDRSAMDGYAVRSDDLANKEVTLEIIEDLPAGKVSEHEVTKGTAVMLMTGAPVPKGADTVVKREDVERAGNKAIFTQQVKKGLNIDPVASDVSQGEKLLKSGAYLGPGELAILASQGYSSVTVYKKPKVAIVITGDELLEVNETLVPGKIRNSNRYMVAAAVRETGAEPIIYPSVPDKLEDTKELLKKAETEADLVISTGGVSMGDFDLVRKALTDIADEVLFWKTKIKPGMPVFAAKKGKTVFLGLSGKPSGALLNFYLLAQPAIKKLSGRLTYLPAKFKARLQNDFKKESRDRTRYLWAQAVFNEEWQVTHKNDKKMNSLLGYNALVEIPANSKPLQKGDLVNIIYLGSELNVTNN